MTSPSPTRLSLIPKLRLNYWSDIIFNALYLQQKLPRWYWPKRKQLPSWVDALVEFDDERLIEREGRGRKPRFYPEKEEASRLNWIKCKSPSKIGDNSQKY